MIKMCFKRNKILTVMMFIFLLFVSLVPTIDGLFSNPDNVLKLLESEKLILGKLENYAIENAVKDESLLWSLGVMQVNQDRAANDPKKYLANPVNTFMLIKRLAIDWKKISEKSEELLLFAKEFDMLLPNDTHVFLTALDIERLQNTYNLKAGDLMWLKINGIQYDGIEMSASDAFELGLKLLSDERCGRAIEWFEESLLLVHDPELFSQIVIQMSICYKELQLNDRVTEINEIMAQCTGLESDDQENFDECKEKLISSRKLEYGVDAKLAKQLNNSNITRHWFLCSGFQERSPTKFKCYYTDNGSPFLKIAPFKAEILNEEPIIVQYHDVLSDREIEVLKKLALPDLKSASLYVNPKAAAEYKRVSNLNWLDDHLHPITDQLNKRIFDMTALNLDSGTALQINRYSIGGHYMPHHDYFPNIPLPEGNRIATLMFYMNDVEQGGRTSFLEAGIAATPKKGSAIFWYNLFPNGTTDYQTLHGGCPVIVGEKWVANRWIHEKGNDFCRKSNLLVDDINFK